MGGSLQTASGKHEKSLLGRGRIPLVVSILLTVVLFFSAFVPQVQAPITAASITVEDHFIADFYSHVVSADVDSGLYVVRDYDRNVVYESINATEAFMTVIYNSSTLYVRRGSYIFDSTVQLSSDAHIVAERGTIFTASKHIDSVFLVSSVSDIGLEGFTIDNSNGNIDFGINIWNSHNVEIKKVSFMGLDLPTESSVTNVFIQTNSLSDLECNSIAISKCTVAKAGNLPRGYGGIYAFYTKGLVIENSTFNDIKAGAVVLGDNNFSPKITGNVISKTDGDGLDLIDCKDFLVEGNQIYYAASVGISVETVLSGQVDEKGVISNNTVAYNKGPGIAIANLSANCHVKEITVTSNVIYNNGLAQPCFDGDAAAIKIIDSKNCKVSNNRVFDNQTRQTQRWGIFESGLSDQNTIDSNDARGNGKGGIYTVGATTQTSANWNGTYLAPKQTLSIRQKG